MVHSHNRHRGTNPIEVLRTTVMQDAYQFSANADSVDGINGASRAEQDLKQLVPAAIAAARSNDDLTAAVKAFYVAAKTYFDSAFTPVPLPSYDVRFGSQPSPEAVQLKITQARLKADLDSKANALELEAQLAGM